MTVVVLADECAAATPFLDWLAPFADSVALLTAAPAGDGAGLASVHVFDGWAGNGSIERHVVGYAAADPVTGVVALCPHDFVRAARLRRHLRLPGADPATVQALFDVTIQRTLVARAGLPVRPYAPVDDVEAIARFLRVREFPVRLRSARFGGGTDTTFTGHDDVDRFFAEMRRDLDEPLRLLVEAATTAPVVTVDGVWYEGWAADPAVRDDGAPVSGGAPESATAFAAAALRRLPLAGRPWKLRVELACDDSAFVFLGVTPLALGAADDRYGAAVVAGCLAALLGDRG